MRAEVQVTAAQLTDTRVPDGTITEAGFRLNVDVALQYLNSWLLENGAAAIYNLMEDVATAEISRAQLWQWIHNGAKLDDGRPASEALYRTSARRSWPGSGAAQGATARRRRSWTACVLRTTFTEFLTLPAYKYLD